MPVKNKRLDFQGHIGVVLFMFKSWSERWLFYFWYWWNSWLSLFKLYFHDIHIKPIKTDSLFTIPNIILTNRWSWLLLNKGNDILICIAGDVKSSPLPKSLSPYCAPNGYNIWIGILKMSQKKTLQSKINAFWIMTIKSMSNCSYWKDGYPILVFIGFDRVLLHCVTSSVT